MQEKRHDQNEKSRPPYGGSALRASKDPAAPIGTAGHWMEGGDSVPPYPPDARVKCNCRHCTFVIDAGEVTILMSLARSLIVAAEEKLYLYSP